MSNYRKTMTEALQEMESLNERMRMPRQLIDTNKEVMIVKKNKVIVIDKKDQDKYMKQGWELAEEVELDESVIDKVKEIASKKSAKKIDGVMVDSFTASAISQIYDKVNDANKKKMEKLPITKLANLAFKMMQKNEFVPEEVDLDEGKQKPYVSSDSDGKHVMTGSGKIAKTFKDMDSANAYLKKNYNKLMKEEVDLDEATMSSSQIARLKKAYEPMRDKKISTSNADKLSAMMDRVGKDKEALIQLFKADIPFVSQSAVTKLITKHNMKGDEINKLREEVDLDEGTKQVLAHGGKGKYKVTKDGDKIEIKFGGKVVGTADFDRGADSFFVSIKGEKGQKSFDDAQAIADYFAKNKITEEVELDEAKYTGKLMKNKSIVDYVKKQQEKNRKDVAKFGNKKVGAYGNEPRFDSGTGWIDMAADEIKLSSMSLNKRKAFDPEAEYEAIARKLGLDKFEPKLEEVDLDEGKMSQLHQMIKDKKSAEEIAKLMKLDVKTVKSLMSSHHPEDVEEGAAADARRAMSRDKDFSRKDSADDDTDASDDDVKGASKNIMMQMRKAQSLNGRFDVEFADGKKVKIPAKMAIAVQQKYNSMKRPAEKEKFQAKVGKSYRDMLSALKEAVSPAQQAAIAISKKERGEKPKKESVLDRIDRKIKENKDG